MGNVNTNPVIEGEVVEDPTRAVAKWTPQFIEPIEAMAARRDQNLEYMAKVLKKDVHYGVIPGTGKKPTLLKPGAQALMRDLGLHPEQVILEHISDVMGKDHGGEVFLSYNIRVDLYALARDGGDRMWVGGGVGSCNSWEERYRWRTSERTCPSCGKAAIIKGNPQYAPGVRDRGKADPGYERGGFLCWKKKDGCGATFTDNDATVAGQQLGKTPNDRVMDLDNTIFKQAAKRALIEAVLNVTGASDVFTQDVEEHHEPDERYEAPPPATTPQAPRAAPQAPQQPAPTRTPWSEEHRDGFKSIYKAVNAERANDPRAAEAIAAFGKFMVANAGGKWENLWANSALRARAFGVFGMDDPAAPPKGADPTLPFDPDAVP